MGFRALEIAILLLDPRKLPGRLRMLARVLGWGLLAVIAVVLRAAHIRPRVRADRDRRHAARQARIDAALVAAERARLQDGWVAPEPAASGPRPRRRARQSTSR